MSLDHTKVYVAHIGSSIMFCGTKEECEAHRAAQPFRTDSWKINSLEDYGFACYEDGADAESMREYYNG